MNPRNNPIILLAVLTLFRATLLQAQDLPAPQNPATLLRELDQITKTAETREQQRRSEAISRIQTAAASPSAATDLYLQALEETKFIDKRGDFLSWKQKYQEYIRHPSYQNAAQLQLRYLLLGLQRSDQHDALAQVNETLAYLNGLQSLHFLENPYEAPTPPKGMRSAPCPSDKVSKEACDLIGKPLTGYPVVEWLRIKDLLPDKDFNGAAGDYFGILEKNVKSPLRQKNDPRITGVWDLQITAASTMANSSKDPQTAVVFKNEKLPNLLYGKCADLAAIGQPNRAVGDMMALIRAYPGNPSVTDWVEAARKLITNSPAPGSSPGATNANAPTAPPTSPTHP